MKKETKQKRALACIVYVRTLFLNLLVGYCCKSTNIKIDTSTEEKNAYSFCVLWAIV